MGKDHERLAGLAVFVGSFAIVVAAHPDSFSGWALWAASPLLLFFLYLLVFRGPPQRLRLGVAGSVAVAYSVFYGLTAGLADESYTAIARVVYLGLPALGLLAMFACIPIIELVGSIRSARSDPHASGSSFQALPFRHAAVGAALVAGWTAFTVSDWTGANVVVSDRGAEAPAALAEVRCSGEDTYLSTPTVVKQADGVHVQIENDGEDDVWLEFEINGGSGGGGAELVRPGLSARVINIPANSIGFACTERGDGSAAEHATAAVVARGQPG